MTFHEMDRTIRSAQSSATGAVDPGKLLAAARGLRDHADALDDELERERARWAGAVGMKPPRLRENDALAAAIEEARRTITAMTERSAQPEDLPALIDAGTIFRDRANVLRNALSDLLDLWRTTSADVQDRRIEGHELLERRDPDETRHYLGDQPVFSGTSLFLLSGAGWLLGRYEIGTDEEPRFFFALPGTQREMWIPIPPNARLAFARRIRVPVDVDPGQLPCIF